MHTPIINPLDAINQEALSGAAPATRDGEWLDLRRKGETTTGRFVTLEERPRTWEGKPVLSRKTGEPRIEWILTFTDGSSTWKLAANESMQSAIRSAIASLGQPLKVGDVMSIEVVAEPREMGQARYAARILPA